MLSKNVLWVDNEPAYVYPFRVALEEEGYNIILARTLSEAESFILREDLALVILDVMMPVTELDLAIGYSPDMTLEGSKAGLAFYRRHQQLLASRQIPVIILTVRIDRRISDDFVAAGLARRNILTKYEVHDAEVFLSRIKAVIEGI